MVTGINEKGRTQKVLTYLATGCREHGLSPEYIAEYIQSVEAIEDPNKTGTRSSGPRSEVPGGELRLRRELISPGTWAEVCTSPLVSDSLLQPEVHMPGRSFLTIGPSVLMPQ